MEGEVRIEFDCGDTELSVCVREGTVRITANDSRCCTAILTVLTITQTERLALELSNISEELRAQHG